MRRFHFRLETIREWRKLQLEVEETKLQRLFEGLRRLEACRVGLEAAKTEAARAVVSSAVLDAQQESACGARIAAQRDSVRKADRDLQLLEELKQRRLAEWE